MYRIRKSLWEETQPSPALARRLPPMSKTAKPRFSIPRFTRTRNTRDSTVITAEPIIIAKLTREKTSANFTNGGVASEQEEAMMTARHTVKPRHAHVVKPKLDMSEERASAIIIAGWVGYRTRNMVLNMSKNLHFGYELQIFEERKRKRGLVFGLVYHVIFMCLMFGAFHMQHGSSVSDRFQLVESIKSEISGIATPVVDFGNSGGVTFDSVSNLDEIWDWSDALIGTLGGQSRVYMRTYNQIVGSMRIESTRVSNASCPYKSSAWNTYISGELRTRLSESEARHPECYGHSSVGALVTPYGPPHDPSKWLADDLGAGFTYKVDLGKDPRYAGYKLQEMRRDGFLSKSTRRVAISMAVYNNALPMICLVKLVFEMSPTGVLTSMYEIEAMNPMPYTSEMFWLQATFELLVMIFALLHVFGEILEVRHLMRKLGRSKGLYDYFSTFWNAMDWMEFALLAVFYVFWFKLLVDISRDVDLDTQDYVNLEEVASDFKVYNLLFNTILLLSLFSMLRFTELDHRMALLTRSISESLSDLGPFMILFSLFLCIFATIGYLLYGSLLYEWATWFQSIITAIDIIMGNYQYVALQTAVPENSLLDIIVSVVYFYVYFFLMMLITLNSDWPRHLNPAPLDLWCRSVTILCWPLAPCQL